MKNITLILLALFIAGSAFAQNFEGIITYKNSFKSKVPNVTDDQFNAMMGTTQEYYAKGGQYKSVTNGTAVQWQLYVNKDNKVYTKMSNSETILWNDATVNDDSIISSQVNKGVIQILGYTCDELVLNCKSGVQKFYFNSKLGLDAALFVNHKYSNWYAYAKIANAIPLKMIIDSQQMTMESVATEINPSKLDDKEFQLPANATTVKSPY